MPPTGIAWQILQKLVKQIELVGRWSKRKTGNHCTARLFIKRVKALCGNQPKMSVFRKGVYHAETNHV